MREKREKNAEIGHFHIFQLNGNGCLIKNM